MFASLVVSALLHGVRSEEANPISKVLQLLTSLEAKITGEGAASQKAYNEFAEFCEERAAELDYALTTSKAEKADLGSAISEEAALIGALTEKIEELVQEIATDNSDLKAATQIRTKEAADFATAEKELMDTIDTLSRAVGILEKHAALLQTTSTQNIAQALGALVQASALSSADADQLTALVQSSQQGGDEDAGAPDAAVYESKSGDIVATLESLNEKAEDQLAGLRKTETTNLHNYELMKQAIEDEVKVGEKDLAEAKKGLAESKEKKAGAEGDFAETEKSMKTDAAALADLHADCTSKAEDFDAETKSRAQELKALGEAKAAVSTSTDGAEGEAYGLNQVSFVQVASGASQAKFAAVQFVRELSKKQRSPALAQLALRMASVMNAQSRTGADPFAKVKGLISDMLEKLEGEAEADASHKAYCDKELSETKVKHGDKTTQIKKLSTKIDGMAARSMQLKSEVAALQKLLAELAAAQSEMDKLRKEEKDLFATAKADLEEGSKGVQVALGVLRDYYAKDDKKHDDAEGAGSGIIGLLEVIESDFSEGLVERTATETAAAAAYDKETKENEVEKVAKESDVKYKTEEATALDKATAEASSDRDGVQEELSAVLEYQASLEKQCIAQAETFEERKRRFEAELAGLKEALKILEGEAVLLQEGQTTRRALRVTGTGQRRRG